MKTRDGVPDGFNATVSSLLAASPPPERSSERGRFRNSVASPSMLTLFD